jgi:mRNA interferase HigB
MHLITVVALREAADDYRDASDEIAAWVKVVRAANWRSFVELKAAIPDADYVDPCVVFNIRRNRYRLIAKIHYVRLKPNGHPSEGHVYFRAFLIHKEYDRYNKEQTKSSRKSIQ